STIPISKLPPTSQERLVSSDSKTILYLAYGSNLSAETFKGARGIKPLSAVNVHVPNLALTFDLSGIPYTEPCFANTKYRDPENDPPKQSDYHKDRWHKGLIGVVYEVTPEDYRTVIATEGGGASYEDILVPCYPIQPGGKTVDPHPSGSPFQAHTLLMPPEKNFKRRTDPSYAQPSARYLKLITDGAEEHALPSEYLGFLYNIRPYTITTRKQKMGQVIFMGAWMPLIMALFGLGRVLADKDGKIPDWMATLMGFFFKVLWTTYDKIFKPMFGDGERTISKGEDDELGQENRW
ncbi:hypothetical protein BJ875DRAFT_353349, partial [Amylocarpus encephaloides]